MKIKLPKGHLSYSAMSLWLNNKSAYRNRYYYNKQDFETPELKYGKVIAQLLEVNDPSVAHVPRLPVPEQSFEIVINEIPVKGYIDSFDPILRKFYEYKTGHKTREGLPPWNRVKVRRHSQLTLYSLAIETMHGDVDNECELIWMETMFTHEKKLFDGHELTGQTRQLELTGHVERFVRNIKQWERIRMKQQIRDVAEEISKDYAMFTGA